MYNFCNTFNSNLFLLKSFYYSKTKKKDFLCKRSKLLHLTFSLFILFIK